MNNLDQLLKILDEGAFITHEEMAEIAKDIRALQDEILFHKKMLNRTVEITPDILRDAERYRWLKRYAGQLLMATEVQIDARIDQAMYGREK